MSLSPWFWVGFNAVVLGLLVLDLFVLHLHERAISWREALGSTLGWIALAVAFGVWVSHHFGSTSGVEFFTGYLIEYALSLDNIFVFVLVFTSFQIEPKFQHRLLFWGVLGALLMRGIMILVGAALLRRFDWIIYVLGAYLIFAGGKMFVPPARSASSERSPATGWVRRWLPLSQAAIDGRFLVREAGRWRFTRLFLVLLTIEFTDLVFALDSIPAVFGVTRDPFIVYTSNVCAILGLRSLYFLLARAMEALHYLRFGLALVLIFIGAKMLLGHLIAISTLFSLGIIGGIFAVTLVASLLRRPPTTRSTHAHP